jgi:hypothetical protein
MHHNHSRIQHISLIAVSTIFAQLQVSQRAFDNFSLISSVHLIFVGWIWIESDWISVWFGSSFWWFLSSTLLLSLLALLFEISHSDNFSYVWMFLSIDLSFVLVLLSDDFDLLWICSLGLDWILVCFGSCLRWFFL